MENENISDDRFKSEVMRLLGVLIAKSNEHDLRFDRLESRFDRLETKVDTNTEVIGKLESRVDSLEKKVDSLEKKIGENTQSIEQLRKELILVKEKLRILSGQFSDVGVMAIKDNQRLIVLENKVAELESRIY